jgi:signal peptidase I
VENGYGQAYGQAPDTGYDQAYQPGYVPPPATRPEEVGGLDSPGAHRYDPAGGGPDGPDGPGDDGGEGGGGGGDDSGSTRSGQERKPRSFWKELPLLVGIALVLALLIKTFLVQAFSIPSESMQNTLQVGDRVLVDKLTPWFGDKPTRGEVVVFHDPGNWLPENPPPSSNPVVRGLQKSLSFIGLMPSAEEKDLIKRVIAVGGDTVSCKGTGPVMVNGKPLNEPYVYAGNTPCSEDKPFTVHVPKGRIWVMGDHRQDSLDSRYHMNEILDGKRTDGTVSDKQVVGRAIVVAWPINRWDWLGIPSTFSQPGINAAGTAAPAALGLAGAAPLVLLRRRRLLRPKRSARPEVVATGAVDPSGPSGSGAPGASGVAGAEGGEG